MNNFCIDLSYPHNGSRLQYVEAMNDIVKNKRELLNLITCRYQTSETETTLIITGARTDVLAWFDLAVFHHPVLETEFMMIKRLMRVMFIQHKTGANGDYHIKLKDLVECYIGPTGKTVGRDWFRKSQCEISTPFAGKKINE